MEGFHLPRSNSAPTPREGAIDQCRGGPAHLDTHVAPGRDALFRISSPLVSDAHASYRGIRTIHTEHLAMIPSQAVERITEAGRGKGPHLCSRLFERAPEARRRRPASKPVIQNAHAHSRTGFLRQDVAKQPARPVVSNDVVLEMDPAFSVSERAQPGSEGRRAIHQKMRGISSHDRGIRRADHGSLRLSSERTRHHVGRSFRPLVAREDARRPFQWKIR